MVCYWTWERGRLSPCSLNHPQVYTDTAALLGQGSVSQESFLPRERQKFAFMESKLEEVAGTAHGNDPLQGEKPW